MTDVDEPQSLFPDARQDQNRWERQPDTPQTLSPSYRLAFADPDFLTREELRPVRLQLELLKPEMALAERGIVSTIAMLGSARIPDPARAGTSAAAKLGRYYEEAREFARLSSERALASSNREDVVCTGGGPGIMEAGNRGAAEAGGVSISLNIVLPHEQRPNLWGTPDLSFNFHYFAVRKMHFLMRARAIAVFPGGFGTLDELFEVLTLIQTGKVQDFPVALVGRENWAPGIEQLKKFVAEKTIDPVDLDKLYIGDDPK